MVPSLSAVYPLSRLLDITANLKFFRMILILICSLTAWSGKWKLGFIADKCKLMHIGYDLPTKYSMTINGTVWDQHDFVDHIQSIAPSTGVSLRSIALMCSRQGFMRG